MLLTLAQQVTACRGEAFVNKALLEPSHSHLLLYYLQLLLHQNSRGECLQQRLYGLLSLKYLLSDSYLTYPAHLTDVPSFFLEVIFNIYLWLLWVFIALRRLCLPVAGGGYSSLWSSGSCVSWGLEHRLNSCGTWAQLLLSMWNLPRPGIEPVSPDWQVPPGKSLSFTLNYRA